jgi:ATP-dependent Clp protease ATP-binding subunit ClpC
MRRLSKYTPQARQALAYAREEGRRLRHRLIGNEHLLLGILKVRDPLIEGLFASLYVSTASVMQALDFVVARSNRAILSEPSLNGALRTTLERAREEATWAQADLVGIEHLLLSILGEHNGVAAAVLESFGVYLDAVRQHLTALINGEHEYLLIAGHYQACYHATPFLNQVSRDLTMAALAGKLDPLIGRTAELERTMQILSRRSKNNPVLIGPAGVGKTAIAEGLALRIIRGQVPDLLLNNRVVALDLSLITMGARFRGDYEERMAYIMQEIADAPGIIIVIDELHMLVQSGATEGSLDASNLFKPMLARSEFRCIATATLDQYRRAIATDPALERRFQPVLVAETTELETLEILRGLRSLYEAFHHVTISDEALQAAVKMSTRYIQSHFQPDKALDLLDEAASHACMQHSVVPAHVRQSREEVVGVQRQKDDAIARHDFPQAARLFKRERQLRQKLWQIEAEWHEQHRLQCPDVGEQDIAEVVAMRTGIPVLRLSEEERLRLLNLESELHERIVGQHDAIEGVARAIRRSYAGIKDNRRPIGSFVFVGPTGVGKTELARALAATLFGEEDALFKLDMSEFMEMHHVSRLIGAPPGYIGYEDAGQLTEAIRRRPYSVVLCDEIDKAHSRVCELLLQILDEGCLTDARGQTVDFKHTIIILTSHLGSVESAQRAIAFTPQHGEREQRAQACERMHERVTSSLQEAFSPELLNRIDEVLIFHPLELNHLRAITDLLIAQTQQRLAQQEIELQISDAARHLLTEHGYDPSCGARHLRRTVQCALEDMFAEAILRGELNRGDSVLVDVVEGELTTKVLAPVPAKVKGREAA